MNIYQKLTDEQFRENSRNNYKARMWFKHHGYMPDPSNTYDLHHIDETLRYTDIDRYIQWNIEDLEVLEHSEHAKKHKHLKQLTKSARSEVANKMWADPNSYVNSQQYRTEVSEAVKKRWLDPNSTYNQESYRKRISQSCKQAWTEELRNKKSIELRKMWADPNSTYNSAESRARRGNPHKKKVILEYEGKIEFGSLYECAEFIGIGKAKSDMIRWMIVKKGYVTTRNSKYRNCKIYFKKEGD